MQNENDMPRWKMILIVAIIFIVVIAVANLLDIRIRTAKYLVYAVVFLVLYFASVVHNKKH